MKAEDKIKWIYSSNNNEELSKDITGLEQFDLFLTSLLLKPRR